MKTNVMRLLDKAHIPYDPLAYEADENDLSGMHTASLLGLPPQQVFKTLVLKGERQGYFVCVIPSCDTIDLRKAAKAAGEKKAELLPMKDLLSVTGYLRGGCSPIGMKKSFPLYIDETAILHERITLSAGMRGALVCMRPKDIIAYTQAILADITVS